MEINGIAHIQLTVNDLGGTDLTAVNADLASAIGGTAGVAFRVETLYARWAELESYR